MRRVFSVAFWTFFGVSSLIGFAVALAIWILSAPFDRRRRLNHVWTTAWAWTYALVYPGWEVSVRHRERIRFGQPYVMVANHTSIADIVLCFGLLRQFKWVSKKAVFKAPLIGWNCTLSGYVPLVRGDAESISRMMDACRSWLRRGISIMMFPEGTRSEDGRVKPFKHGAFTLALESGVPVVPVAIHGGHALIPKHGASFATRATLAVEVLEPVPPDGFKDAAEYAEAVRSVIIHALDRDPTGTRAAMAPPSGDSGARLASGGRGL